MFGIKAIVGNHTAGGREIIVHLRASEDEAAMFKRLQAVAGGLDCIARCFGYALASVNALHTSPKPRTHVTIEPKG